MKALLLHRARAFDLAQTPCPNEEALVSDLDLNTLLEAMAGGDAFLFDVARRVLLQSLSDVDAIRYRQDVCRDCLSNAAVVTDMYRIAVAAIEQEGKQLRFRPDYTAGLLRRAIAVLQGFGGMLWDLRGIAESRADDFESEGFARLFAMLRSELDDAFFERVGDHLAGLEFREGVLVSAALGAGNKGVDHILHAHGGAEEPRQGWLKGILGEGPRADIVTVDEGDEAGLRALSDLRDTGLAAVAAALDRSANRILGFFTELRTELAFYMACLNLRERLSRKGEPVSFPMPMRHGEFRFSCKGLYDVSLALQHESQIVGNEVDADEAQLVVITGANQGGKSTFLRSVGQAQLMMQAGMFVPATAFAANVSDGVFTHFRREEDAGMESGKLDEELGRMSGIVEEIAPNAMLLLNESFAATNEREGSEIARQVVRALLERGVKMFFVTHLHDFARGLCEERGGAYKFLRAERREDGTRTFRVTEGEPLSTSYGKDLYGKIFGPEGDGPAGRRRH